MYIYIYIYDYMYVYIYVYMYIYIYIYIVGDAPCMTALFHMATQLGSACDLEASQVTMWPTW